MPVVLHHRLSPLLTRQLNAATLTKKLTEINNVVRELQDGLASMQGARGQTVSLQGAMDLGGNRVQNVGTTRRETDVPNVRELRQQAMYARDGIHETDKLILARGGVRSVTPAVAANDLITKGQVEELIQDLTGVSSTATTTSTSESVTTVLEGLAFTQQNVTVADGHTSEVAATGVFVRITGPTAAFSIGGFTGGADGRWLILFNASDQDVTFVDEDAGATATNRLLTLINADLTMTGNGMTQWIYSAADARWVSL